MHWVFGPTNVRGNVRFNFLGSPINDLAAFAEGYHRAGRVLADRLTERRGFPEYEGYPVLYLYRHALELSLKAIVYHGLRILRLLECDRPQVTRLLESHALSRLLPAIREIFKGVGWDFDADVKGMCSYEEFAELLTGIEEVDPGSLAFRYPVNRHGEAVLDHHTVVNVLDFARNMDPILDLLSGTVTGLREEFDATAEMRSELEGLLRTFGESE